MDTPEYCICEQYTILPPQTPSPGVAYCLLAPAWASPSPQRIPPPLKGKSAIKIQKNMYKQKTKPKINFMTK
ncbi:hypothetical protein KAM448_30040 [Aeromonas caviae]|uniref:Uncharacterized protein n=1 Tax=Aeromonas caviae TaxID=648 RepID=A0ABD0B895_AERCA|nr:hypothetical protein KAM376_39730 [Aeromonas caviae]GJA82310.1 hypothetical protein KAM355_28700 [Aeromonas caviae]GJA97565.1 hypothetical protein KAM359_09730 [Aeromonas caviae]GJB11304.1 hypothetical protein KAM362_18640 [Aeromonas caviae]GJB24794.1 hypothetical protein KAM365_25440 [Aeromonas caviae]